MTSNSFLNVLDLGMEMQADIDRHVASMLGGSLRAGANAAHVTKADVTGELHILEAEVVGASLLGFIAVAAIAIMWVVPKGGVDLDGFLKRRSLT